MSMQTFNSIRCSLALCACMAAGSRLAAQATAPLYDPPPAYPGFQLPHVAGSLRYSFTGSGTGTFGSQNVNSYSQGYLSGNMGYISRSVTRSFSMIYSGGYRISSGSESSGFYQSIGLSQQLALKRWRFLISDSLSYLPQSPVSGLSGVAGVGDLGAAPVDSGALGAELQSNPSTRVSNTASASVSRILTGRTSATGSAAYDILRFPGSGAGLALDTESFNLGLSHVISPRTQVSGSYFYTHTSYQSLGISNDSQGVNVALNHSWSARLTTSFSGGPVHTSSTGVQGTNNVSYGAAALYTRGLNHFSLNADRQVRSGSGVTTATREDAISATVSRGISRFTSLSANVSYLRSTTLPSLISQPYTISSLNPGVQISRSLSRTISTYASYNLRRQNLPTNAFAVNALQGATQTVGFGLTYTPRAITVGSQ